MVLDHSHCEEIMSKQSRTKNNVDNAKLSLASARLAKLSKEGPVLSFCSLISNSFQPPRAEASSYPFRPCYFTFFFGASPLSNPSTYCTDSPFSGVRSFTTVRRTCSTQCVRTRHVTGHRDCTSKRMITPIKSAQYPLAQMKCSDIEVP